MTCLGAVAEVKLRRNTRVTALLGWRSPFILREVVGALVVGALGGPSPSNDYIDRCLNLAVRRQGASDRLVHELSLGQQL